MNIMELSQLKKNIHAYVDDLDDENALLAMAEVLEKYGHSVAENTDYEQTVAFKNELNEALEEANRGDLRSNEETLSWLKNRAWRTK
jgi:hypothetical protein